MFKIKNIIFLQVQRANIYYFVFQKPKSKMDFPACVSRAILLYLILTIFNTGETEATKQNKSEVCNRANLDKCLDKVSPILSKAELIGIPSSKEKVDASCKAFKTGMGCVDDYSKKCFGVKEKKLLDDQVAGARYTFKFLCDDPVFQSEYLQYTSCFRGVTEDWDSCASHFMSLLREEMSRKNVSQHGRIIERCCAKYGFQRCVFAATRIKCGKEEAVFLNKIAETLSSTRVYTAICRNINTDVCSSSSYWRSNGFLTSLLLLTHLKCLRT